MKPFAGGRKKRTNLVVALAWVGLLLAGVYIVVSGRQGVPASRDAVNPRVEITPEPLAAVPPYAGSGLPEGSTGSVLPEIPGHGPPFTPVDCGGSAQQPLRKIPTGGIVKWEDGEGITHYEDYHGGSVPPGRQLVTRFPDSKDYFSLRIDVASGSLPGGLRSQLSERATWVYEVYRALLPEQFLSRADVHLVVHNRRSDYEAVRGHYVGNDASEVPGFFVVSDNRAEILRQGNGAETLKIMVHEVVHVINNQLFGPLPRWLNEGLATYIDALDTDRQRPSTAGERLHLIKKQVGVPLLERVSVPHLLATGQLPWDRGERAHYYPFSQLLTTYLLQPQNRGFTGPFLRYLTTGRCVETDVPGYMESNYPGGVAGLDADFRHWLRREP